MHSKIKETTIGEYIQLKMIFVALKYSPSSECMKSSSISWSLLNKINAFDLADLKIAYRFDSKTEMEGITF